MIGLELLLLYMVQGEAKRAIDQKMRHRLPPDQYRKWRAERDAEETAERRHSEMLRAIRDAGESAGRRRND